MTPLGYPPPPDLIERFRAGLTALAAFDPQSSRLGVAVSGGPDSLALLLLSGAAFPGAVFAATVDHGLRPEAAAEARFVARLCAVRDIPHCTLRPVTPIAGSVQSAARAARYDLLADWCADEAISHLATAHHVDDQAETLMMRLLRGSGVAGMSGIRAAAPFRGRWLVRPLLGWRRDELAGIVHAAGVAPIDDPSNHDARFDRVRMRRRLADIDWIDAAMLAQSAAAMAEADAALEWAVDEQWHVRVIGTGERYSFAPAGLPPELVRRLVLRIVRRLVPDAAPRNDRLQALLAGLREGRVATLAGVKCTGGDAWTFTLAPPRRGN